MTKQQKIKEQAIIDAAKDGSASKAAAKAAPSKDSKPSALYADNVYAGLSAKLRKSFRSKIRKQRNKFASTIVASKGKGKAAELKMAISDFSKFYKANYKLNDLSPESLGAKNSDQDTKELISGMLAIIVKAKK